ncbi:LptF/LptG family permease [Parachryseolinea silvisoli]|uniref:LptF/LptG family permease n=1 Tax=Parachryseolinea silvisoli TaxID=2873601 RepID=UPI002265A3D8|nr:LptF/LptG family permease [Parachryseolinea silvisoli]MCD9018275.1 LptF/LptG family permease [Parachryseolinea silvisoli]
MKKIDKLVLGAFLGPFVLTFLVVVFILLTQHMLKYFDDIIGKGLGADVIGQLLFYFAIFMTPVALPLAVLLSSLIAFGNLGEHFELTAIKAAGVSLIRAMAPICVFVVLLTGVAFYVNNNLVPKAALEAYSLLYDIKQKKPALDLREGAFYNGISDISIKVNKKFPDGVTLRDVVLYDHRKNDGNKEVTVADSGRMYTILNERYLKFELYNGYQYTEGASSEREMTGQKKRNPESLSRSQFSKAQVVFDLSSFNLERTDKKFFQGNRIMRNLNELDKDIDSTRREILTQRLNYYQYRPSYFTYLFRKDSLIMPREVYHHKQYRDSIARLPYIPKTNPVVEAKPAVSSVSPPPAEADGTKAITKIDTGKTKASSSLTAKADTNKKPDIKRKPNGLEAKRAADRRLRLNTVAQKSKTKKKSTAKKRPSIVKPVPPPVVVKKKVLTDSARRAKLDSIFTMPAPHNVLQGAANQARQVKSQIENVNTSVDNSGVELRTFEIQWHKIFSSSMACLAMFLIGAPLGSIIKRGGLGVPFLVSILFFIIYYITTMQGEKLAKQAKIGVVTGVWMADFLLLIVGLFFLRQARIDARLFEADFYRVVLDKVKQWFQKRKAPATAVS